MPKNVSEVTLVTKYFIFLKILNFVQSFVECKVSLADGMPGRERRAITSIYILSYMHYNPKVAFIRGHYQSPGHRRSRDTLIHRALTDW
jgi:hypothetical protein